MKIFRILRHRSGWRNDKMSLIYSLNSKDSMKKIFKVSIARKKLSTQAK